MTHPRTLVVIFLSAGAALLSGCVTDGSQRGVPAPSWYTATQDGTMVPHVASTRMSDPNVYNEDRPLWWHTAHSPDRAVASSVGPYDNLNEPWPVRSSSTKPAKSCKDMSCCDDNGSCTQPCCKDMR
jgi:hypothetical protein